MAKLTTRISVPIIMVGIFAIAIFTALNYDRLDLGFYVIVLFFAIYVFFFGYAIGQNITSPIKTLLDRATEISKGNLSSRVYLETKDEFAELARVLNQIAEELEASHTQEENTEKSVGIKVKARTEELEETINALEQKVKNRTIELERLLDESTKLQEAVKNKEVETIQLKEELTNFKQKVDKYNKVKSVVN